MPPDPLIRQPELPVYCVFLVAIRALPRKLAFSSRAKRGASMSPRSMAPASSAQRSEATMLPSILPRTTTDLALISPRMRACSPTVNVPVELILPSTSPSMTSSPRKVTLPLIETSLERTPPSFALDDPLSTGRSNLAGAGGDDDGVGGGGAGSIFLLDPNICKRRVNPQ